MSTAFRPCLVIPVYNHGTLIAATLERLVFLGLPCLLVDDGSESSTADELERLAASYEWVTLFRQPENSGKGVAVLRGIEEAHRLGFSHALQIDADGQHAAEDIPRMLVMAKAEPQALISGAPVYDESVPRSRLYGRYITHFWVWIETLSFSVIDSMCGFRVYPVAATEALAKTEAIGQRMDFDTDVMVRLYWRGVPLRFLKTRVHYPADGVSHFQLWQDNLRISWMHTRLVLGMLRRLPVLLWRKLVPTTGADQGVHWSEMRENGAYMGMAMSVACYRLLGRRILNALLYGIIAYFFITNAGARKESQAFLQRVFQYRHELNDELNSHGPLESPGWRNSFRHFMNFGRDIVDRIGAWLGDIQRDQVYFPDRHLLMEYIDQGRGGIILSSHLGNIEMCRGLVDRVHHIKMNVLVFNDHAAQINRLMRRINPRIDMELIQINTVGPDTAIYLKQKIDQGEFIVIAADRTSPTAPEKSTPALFLGRQAYFPQGAFILAGLLECPVFTMFCLRDDEGQASANPRTQLRYQIYFELFAEKMTMPRKQRTERLNHYTQRYAQCLEHYALKAPEQWYNFFDFWAPPKRLIADEAEGVSLTGH